MNSFVLEMKDDLQVATNTLREEKTFEKGEKDY